LPGTIFEVLGTGPMKLRGRRGLDGVYELYGRNYAGEYLHIAYRREADREVVFHIRAMSPQKSRRTGKTDECSKDEKEGHQDSAAAKRRQLRGAVGFLRPPRRG